MADTSSTLTLHLDPIQLIHLGSEIERLFPGNDTIVDLTVEYERAITDRLTDEHSYQVVLEFPDTSSAVMFKLAWTGGAS